MVVVVVDDKLWLCIWGLSHRRDRRKNSQVGNEDPSFRDSRDEWLTGAEEL
jgi:hypothetical protein